MECSIIKRLSRNHISPVEQVFGLINAVPILQRIEKMPLKEVINSYKVVVLTPASFGEYCFELEVNADIVSDQSGIDNLSRRSPLHVSSLM